MAPYFGTHLGMTARDVRERFIGAEAGRWTFSGTSIESVLKWVRAEPSADLPASISFELHAGVVVSIRADLEPTDPLAQGAAVEASFFSVVARELQENGPVRLKFFARDCSEHVAEVAALLSAKSSTDGGAP